MFNCFFFKRKREQKKHEQSIGDGLPAAIEHFVEEIQTAGGPDIEFCHELGRDRLPRNLRKAAFRIVKESLANACRHSKSKRLFAELSVDDDVSGFDFGTGESTSPPSALRLDASGGTEFGNESSCPAARQPSRANLAKERASPPNCHSRRKGMQSASASADRRLAK